MDIPLLKSQLDRLLADPSDQRLLKQLAVEAGARMARSGPDMLRELRVAFAPVYRTLTALSSTDALYASGVLVGLLDALACAEETQRYDENERLLQAEQERQ